GLVDDRRVGQPVLPRPARPERWSTQHDQVWSDGTQRLVVETELAHDPGTVVLDQNIALGDELEHCLSPGGLGQVQSEVAFAGVGAVEVGAALPPARLRHRPCHGHPDAVGRWADSTWITSAPSRASGWLMIGPAQNAVMSATRNPASGSSGLLVGVASTGRSGLSACARNRSVSCPSRGEGSGATRSAPPDRVYQTSGCSTPLRGCLVYQFRATYCSCSGSVWPFTTSATGRRNAEAS